MVIRQPESTAPTAPPKPVRGFTCSSSAGWRVDHVGTSTYLGIFKPDTLDFMQQMTASNPDMAKRLRPLQKRLKVIGPPLLDNYQVHVPIWAVAATRLD